jgi:hypothetical protein
LAAATGVLLSGWPKRPRGWALSCFRSYSIR